MYKHRFSSSCETDLDAVMKNAGFKRLLGELTLLNAPERCDLPKQTSCAVPEG